MRLLYCNSTRTKSKALGIKCSSVIEIEFVRKQKIYWFLSSRLSLQMPELSDAVATNPSPEMASIIENLQKQKLNTTTRQNVINSSSSSIKETSSSSQQVSECYFRFLGGLRTKSANAVECEAMKSIKIEWDSCWQSFETRVRLKLDKWRKTVRFSNDVYMLGKWTCVIRHLTLLSVNN